MTNNHITIEESAKPFFNSTLCINKVNISTTLEDIEEAFIYRDIPIKNLKKMHESWWVIDDFSYIKFR